MYIETVRFIVPPSGAEGFEAAVRGGVAEMLQSNAQCFTYELSRGVGDPATYVLRIEWTEDSDRIGGVRDGEHLSPLLAELRPHFLSVAEAYITETTTVRGDGGAILGLSLP
ncbi:putative quinol monooxygenase [Catenulispora subtropica]|uniref:ABM domain-containing protein n=1 Tax=Catenulispora subtropica TaxID=450798 RepID=A0ABP5E5R4_9ACTN